MTKYTSYLEDAVYCNDRTVAGYGWWDTGYERDTSLKYEGYTRTVETFKPSLKCTNIADSFTVANDKGNGKLTYPVGLITSDEAMLAGATWGKNRSVTVNNTSFYLYTGQVYWTMTPLFLWPASSKHSYMVALGSILTDYIVNPAYWGGHPDLGVRPVISLKNGTKYVAGDGSLINPYVVNDDIDLCKNKKDKMPFFSEKAISDINLDFSKISSDTNGKGLYLMHGTEFYEYPIYYYRGAVNDNNVLFANFCWKIVRTTETGGIKMIYNGKPVGGKCTTSSGTGTQITTEPYNGAHNLISYVGYMYPDTNKNDSTIKKAIDTWYSKNLLSYASKLEDTPFCNDRGISGNTWGGTHTIYNAYKRATETHLPLLNCIDLNDAFTVSSDSGNKKLTYPIGLLTLDEVMLAGGCYGLNNTSYYLYTGQVWWTMTPAFFQYSDSGAYMHAIGASIPTYKVNPMYWSHPCLFLPISLCTTSGSVM